MHIAQISILHLTYVLILWLSTNFYQSSIFQILVLMLYSFFGYRDTFVYKINTPFGSYVEACTSFGKFSRTKKLAC